MVIKAEAERGREVQERGYVEVIGENEKRKVFQVHQKEKKGKKKGRKETKGVRIRSSTRTA
jgi:hypothetical protein